MNNTKACIQNGDLVIIYESFKSITYVYVNSSEIFQNRFGAFYHEDMIGKPFGSQLRARKSRGYITLLNPTPELWTLALNHRTQIIFTPDISAIIANLELRPGHVVIESGTGSIFTIFISYSQYSFHITSCRHGQWIVVHIVSPNDCTYGSFTHV